MRTERQTWAMNRNWLIRRLRGSLSIFSYDNKMLINQLVNPGDAEKFYIIESNLRYLIKEISKSTYKEKS